VAVERRLVEFEPDDTAEAEAIVAAVCRGEGWVNIEPVLDTDEVEALQRSQPSALVRLFSGKGRPLPFASLVPGDAAKAGRPPNPLQLGLEHPAGPRAVATLRERGVVLPEGWAVRQDHPKRGLVLDVPPAESPERILAWVLAAAVVLGDLQAAWFGGRPLWSAVHHRQS
jgi:hypothetical protein